MKIQKLTESVFEKLKDATTVINPVTADAVKDNDMREKAVEKILKERGQGKEFTGSSEKTPEVPVAKPALEESFFDTPLTEKHDKSLPPTKEWQDLGNDGREKYDFWDKIYAELIEDPSFANNDTRNKLRELPDPDPEAVAYGRYKESSMSLTPEGDIRINVSDPKQLNFAKEVADHYNIPSEERTSNRFKGLPYSLTLYISRMEDSADRITDKVLQDK